MSIAVNDTVSRKHQTPFVPLLNVGPKTTPVAGDLGKVVRIFPSMSGPEKGKMYAEVNYHLLTTHKEPIDVSIAVLVSNLVRIEI